jgi:hypothetical protein
VGQGLKAEHTRLRKQPKKRLGGGRKKHVISEKLVIPFT